MSSDQRDIEIRRLQNRVRQLEAEVQRFKPQSHGSKSGVGNKNKREELTRVLQRQVEAFAIRKRTSLAKKIEAQLDKTVRTYGAIYNCGSIYVRFRDLKGTEALENGPRLQVQKINQEIIALRDELTWINSLERTPVHELSPHPLMSQSIINNILRLRDLDS